MATILPDNNKPHNHMDIFAMPSGGYVVGQAQWDNGQRDINWCNQHLAAFTTLREAVAWLEANMVNRPSKGK